MSKSCPNCGTAAAAEASFCRQCGTSLRVATSATSADELLDNSAAPPAATKSFSDYGRSTDGLAADHPQGQRSSNTTRVAPEEISELPHQTYQTEVFDPEATVIRRPALNKTETPLAGPQTSELTLPPDSARFNTSVLSAPAEAAAPASDTSAFDSDDERTVVVTPPAAQTASAATPSRTVAHIAPPQADKPTASLRRRWWPIAAAASLLIAVPIVWFATRSMRDPASPEPSRAPVAVSDPKQLANRKLSEAQALLFSGDMQGALRALREASKIDPTNAEAHRRLGEMLFQSGARREAIEEFRAATQINSGDTAAWRSLASAQFAEGLYNEAAESFRRLFSETNEADPDNTIRLYYADALRLAGRIDEARAAYETLTASSSTDVARAAAQRLTELAALPAAEVEAMNSEIVPPLGSDSSAPVNPSELPLPTLPAPSASVTVPTFEPPRPAASASDPYTRGVQLWSQNRATAVGEFRQAAQGGNPDAYYYLGLSIAEGRDPQTLNRSELVSALEYFQRARSGRFGASARQYEERLGGEFDRRRNGR